MASSNPHNAWVLLGLGLGVGGLLLLSRRREDEFGAFIQRLRLIPPPQRDPDTHPLTSLTFAVSDIFDIEGYVTGFGNPDWAKTHEAASQTSPVVSSLVNGGATCIGKTVVAYSINGENNHYGTPTNPEAPERVPGGSSSGAAVAVAANLVDFSLGVDGVGGVRLPAAYCGVLGFRPSYGTVSSWGVSSTSILDTVGWFAKNHSVLCRVADVLLQLPTRDQPNPRKVIMADDCFEQLNIPTDRITQVVIRSTQELFGEQVLEHENVEEYLYSSVPSLKYFYSNEMEGEPKTSTMRLLAKLMKLLHGYEFKGTREEWIRTEKPILDPVIPTQINDVSDSEIEIWRTIREEMRSAINTLLKDDGILVIPTTASLPPKLCDKEDNYQTSSFSLLSIASLSGCCQVTIPLGQWHECPVSVSLIARHGGDHFLLKTMQSMYNSLQEQVNVHGKEKSAEIYRALGSDALEFKEWERAIFYYTKAIELNGENGTYYRDRGAAYLGLSSYMRAEEDCTKAIDLDARDVKAYVCRGTARVEIGSYTDALTDFRCVLVLEPSNKTASDSAEGLLQLDKEMRDCCNLIMK